VQADGPDDARGVRMIGTATPWTVSGRSHARRKP
jgi:hypothetical protein